ncbi:hypothetical protein [Shewanella livingstonensis]|uniref:hypothetical protein n=1 Tax=Shewanella livingstonensis TaxID=150120 RepID=UPI0026B58C21
MMTRQQSPIATLTRAKKGNLVCVGTGLQLAGQIGALSLSYIEHADVVFSLVPDGFSERWLMSLNTDVRSLQPYYAQHDEVKNRRDTYAEMVDAILDEVRLGKLGPVDLSRLFLQRIVGHLYKAETLRCSYST